MFKSQIKTGSRLSFPESFFFGGGGGTTTEWEELVGAHRKKKSVLKYGPSNLASFLIKGKPLSSRVHRKESRKEIPRGLKDQDNGRRYYYEKMCFGL